MSKPQHPISDLPKFPDLTAVYPALATFVERFKEMEAALRSAMAPLQETFRIIGEQHAVMSRIEAAGWLPHSSTPYDRIKADLPPDEIDRIFTAYYRDEWPEAEAAFSSNLDGYPVDDEARATVGEALRAHAAGLYRVAPRLLFPEIERVARIKLHAGEYTTITSQKTLQAAVGELGLSGFSPPGMYGLELYRKLITHLYARVETEKRRGAALADPVPNRHAALHGIVSYSSAKSSVNMLIMCDFILGAITAIEANSTAEEAGADAEKTN